MYSEIFTKTKPRQAPRLLWGSQKLVRRQWSTLQFLPIGRVYARFYLVQAWNSLRFDDHRGVEVALLKRRSESLSGVSTRSKTHGPERVEERKAVYLDRGCWLTERGGWTSACSSCSRWLSREGLSLDVSKRQQQRHPKSGVVLRRVTCGNVVSPPQCQP